MIHLKSRFIKWDQSALCLHPENSTSPICFCAVMLFVSALFNPLWGVDSSAHLSVQARLKGHMRCRGGSSLWPSTEPEKSSILFMNHSAIDYTHLGTGWSTQGARNTGGPAGNSFVVQTATVSFIKPLTWPYHRHKINIARRLNYTIETANTASIICLFALFYAIGLLLVQCR